MILWSRTNGFRIEFLFLVSKLLMSLFFFKFTPKIKIGVIVVTLKNEYGTIVIVNFRDC